jgi:ribosome maturation factor RimP
MDKDALRGKISRLSEPLAKTMGLELVSIELSGSTKNLKVSIFLDKPEGLTLEDCANFSRSIGDQLDEADFVPVGYTLEVSSPGLDRELKTPQDFERFTGKLVKLRAKEPVGGQRNFIGRLQGLKEGRLVLEDRTSGLIELPLEKISKANLEIDLEEELNRQR